MMYFLLKPQTPYHFDLLSGCYPSSRNPHFHYQEIINPFKISCSVRSEDTSVFLSTFCVVALLPIL